VEKFTRLFEGDNRVRNFRYLSPKSLNEALSLLEEGNEANTYIIAGGTDLLIRLKNGEINADSVIDLKAVPLLSDIKYDQRIGLRIGALSSIASIEKYPTFPLEYTALPEAASSIGSAQIRNRGTIGGNLCNASPSGDLAPALIVMDATVEISGEFGQKAVKLEGFFVAPGKTVLKNTEILTEILVPKPCPRSGSAYLKLGRRKGLDLAIVSVACLLAVKNDAYCEVARIALGAVGPTPLRARNAEALMIGKEIDDELIEKVARKAAEEARPISDIRATADYRKEIINVLVRRAINVSMRRVALLTQQTDD